MGRRPHVGDFASLLDYPNSIVAVTVETFVLRCAMTRIFFKFVVVVVAVASSPSDAIRRNCS